MALRYARVLVLAFLVAVVLAHIPQTRLDPLGALDQRTGPHLLAILLAGLFGLVVLSRLLGELRPR